jgi:hypothetical protein
MDPVLLAVQSGVFLVVRQPPTDILILQYFLSARNKKHHFRKVIFDSTRRVCLQKSVLIRVGRFLSAIRGCPIHRLGDKILPVLFL